MNDLPKAYDPKGTEEKIYKTWEESGFFNPDNLPGPRSKRYSVMMAPPNITGILHIGHTLENTMIDILVRMKRMQGYKALWMPGIDHAGIATQNVVEKELRKQGKTRFELGREKFVSLVWEWKEKYGYTILGQFKKLGISSDWSRLRFTLDVPYVKAVQEAFIHYYKKKMLYRGLRTINWCVRCQTSISDLEVDYKEENTTLYYIMYGPFTLATVRPETKFGDTALAVHPADKRYKKYIGKEIEIESLDIHGSLDAPAKTKIQIQVVGDTAVDPKFGTGVIKVTPAHDGTDYEIAQRHNLPLKQVIDEYGRINEGAGKYAGMKVIEARKKIVDDLRAVGLLVKEEAYTHNLAVCERCGLAIEPLPSWQWFLKMDDLAKKAKALVYSGRTNITPKNFEKLYFAWLDTIRDWCVSRQLWWGHQLPVWFCKNKPEEFKVSGEKFKVCPICKHCDMEQSPDVLDTWFSSALWPFATLGWPEQTKDLKIYYPTDFITCAREILNLWIARMIFSGGEFLKKYPFKTALIHGTVLTKDGKRMSKSLGTGIDPVLLIETHGADATRFGIIWQAMGTQDIRWDDAAVVAGKKFANKVWNAARFVIGKMNDSKSVIQKTKPRASTKENKTILSQLETTKKQVEQHLETYQFGHALHCIYDFFWHDVCDVYLEWSKQNPSAETSAVLGYVLFSSLKLVHPFMPFITEELYQHLPLKEKKLLMVEPWSC